MVFGDKGTKKHKKNNNFQLKNWGTIPLPCCFFCYILSSQRERNTLYKV